jgi:hypothetical protein
MEIILKPRGLLLFAGMTALFILIGASVTNAVPIYGLTTTNQLVRFESTTPGTIDQTLTITGLPGGEVLIGIDFRPANRQLYALSGTGDLYVINLTSGAATAIGTPITPALSGTEFGMDFNPVPDRLRIVSDAEQNLAANPNTGGAATVNGNLAYAAGDPNLGQNPNIVGAGYTNSFAGATTVTLYDIDSNLNILVTQNPATGALTTVGALGVNPSNLVGLDIQAAGANNIAYASFVLEGDTVAKLFTINLTTGTAALAGNIASGGQVRDIAIAPPAVPSLNAFALTTSNALLRFNTSAPQTIQQTLTVTGLTAGDTLMGVDFRPATGQLFAFAQPAVSADPSRLYTINPSTGVATLVGNLSIAPTGTTFGFNFNPTVDRIRIVSELDQNLRTNPADASVVMETALGYMTGDVNAGANPNVVAASYNNSFGGSTATTLYDIDSTLDVLVTQNPAASGMLQTVGSLGVDTSSLVGFEIASANNAFAVLTVGGIPTLYTINLSLGTASRVGTVGTGAIPVRGLTIGFNRATADFDGNGRTDYSVFRTANNTWFILGNGTDVVNGQQFGLSQSDVLTPGDYDGDGRADLAVWRESSGTFFVLRSATNTLQAQPFGTIGDEPVARDYDGDGRTDFAVVRRTGGQMLWFLLQTTAGFAGQQFGLDSDFVAPGDYDGDGRADLVVNRGSGGQATFYIQQSTAGFRGQSFGLSSDLIVPGDYDGDGKTDIAVFRSASQASWFVLRSSDSSVAFVAFGLGTDFPTQGDYDGDGKTDVAVWRPSNGTFFVGRSSNVNSPFSQNWGIKGDYPVANFDTH